MPTNPYAAAAVRKAQALRALRLPPAQAADRPEGRAVTDFLEAGAAGGPKAGMMRSILRTGAVRQMTTEQITATQAHLTAQREREAQKYREMDAPPCIIENVLRPGDEDKILARELKRRGGG